MSDENSSDTTLADLIARVAQLESIVMKLGPAIPDVLAAVADLKTYDFADLISRVSKLEADIAPASEAIPNTVAAVADIKAEVLTIGKWVQSISGENILSSAFVQDKATA